MEVFDPNRDYSDGQILALTPKACYQLDRQALAYRIIDEYCSHEDLLRKEEGYLLSLLGWVNDFDCFLAKNIPLIKKLSLHPLRSFYKFIEIAMGGILIRSHQLARFVTKENPSSIIYIYDNDQDLEPDHGFGIIDKSIRERSRSLYLQLIPLVCAAQAIDLEVHKIATGENLSASINLGASKLDVAKDMIKRSRLTSWIYSGYRTCKSVFIYRTFRLLISRPKPGKGLNLLITRFAPQREEFIQSALNNRERVFLKEGKSIFEVTPFGARRRLIFLAPNKGRSRQDLLDQCKKCASDLASQKKLLNWANDWAGFNITGIILPKLTFFIQKLVPEFAADAELAINFYDRCNIDFALSMYEVEVSDFAMIAATRSSKSTKSVHLQHGESIYPMSPLGEFDHFDYYLSSEEGMEWDLDKIHDLKRLNDCHIYRSSYRLRHLRQIKNNRHPEACSATKKKEIVYVPRIAAGDRCYFNVPSYSVTWHYKLQRKIIEYFAKRTDFNFTWKGAPGYDNIYNPIEEFIKDSGFSNIKTSTAPLYECLGWADRVINDFLSSAVYETTAAGVPMLALRYRGFMPRDKRVLDIFGNTVTDFQNSDEAISKIDKFLRAKPEEYVIDLPLDNNDMLQVLRKIKDDQ